MPWGPKYDPQYGALVKIVNDSKVYLLLGTERYWINSESVFTGLKYDWNWIEDVDEELLAKYSVGSEISYTTHHPNYTLVKYSNSPKVYRLEPDPKDASKQVKRHIADEKAFESLKFRWDRIVVISTSETYLDGASLTSVPSSSQTSTTKPASGSSYTFVSFLSQGSSGDEVTQLQLVLQKLGYLSKDVQATGNYGSATTEAVKKFQQAKGLDPLGYVGPGTRTALNSI
ncbi:MAG: peptidoglycan-binding protein [Candidatus Magasanikbacteria bacterium]|nr:peptidoglycan-binding protein [Candidatus Magasanikbacteria bacterium]